VLLRAFVFVTIEQSVDSTVAGWMVFLESTRSRRNTQLVLKRVIVTAAVVQRRQLDHGHMLADLLLRKVLL